MKLWLIDFEEQKKFLGLEWHQDTFPEAVFRLKNPKTATLQFSTGKMVCTGAKSSVLTISPK